VARFVKGDIVVIPFPFSDLSQSKRRPALVISVLEGEDLILCQITSRTLKDRYSVSLHNDDFEQGSLEKESNVRPNRLFTAEKSIVIYKIGVLKKVKLNEIVKKVVDIIRS
jgi:mRNA interferase MazF